MNSPVERVPNPFGILASVRGFRVPVATQIVRVTYLFLPERNHLTHSNVVVNHRLGVGEPKDTDQKQNKKGQKKKRTPLPSSHL